MITYEKKRKSPLVYIAVIMTFLVALGFHFYTGMDNSGSAKVEKMRKLTRQAQGIENNLKKHEGDVMALQNQYCNIANGDTPITFDGMKLTPQERGLLEEKINREQNISAHWLLKEILLKKERILQLSSKIADIQKQLPMPYVAQKGDSHYKVSFSFLVDMMGLEKEEAGKILACTALVPHLAEGYNVWNFYVDGQFGTSVTQGEAGESPNAFAARIKKGLMDARDQVIAQRDHLVEGMKSMQEQQKTASNRFDTILRENEQLISKVNHLTKKANSMYYRLGSKKNLQKNRILKRSFLTSSKLTDIAPAEFNHALDLSTADQLTVSADDLGVTKIKGVVIYPRFYKKNSSYKVEIADDRKHALITLMDTDKFKSERVVIAVN